MKSQQSAQRTFRHLCNKSKTKYQYSFAKDQRFHHTKKMYTDSFYQIPSHFSKLANTFGKSKRPCQQENKIQGPPPSKYDPKSIETKGQISFGMGRNQCKAESVFLDSTAKYPGPGTYQLDKKEVRKAYSMVGKQSISYQTASPGPKYNFGSTMLQRNKILSKEVKNGSMRIMLPTSKSRLSSEEDSRRHYTSASKVEGVINRKGDRSIGTSGSKVVIPRETRFKTVSFESNNPGPGYYDSFSQFIHSKIK